MARLRMKDLVERTGASREAIRFYINEGLLPEPNRTSRNMAWYSPEHVSRVRYIRALQEEHFLPLKAIRAVLDGRGSQQFTAQQMSQFDALRRQVEAEHASERRRRFEPLADELGLTPQERDAARRMGFVNADDSMGPADEELVRLWVRMREQGLTPERGFGPDDLHMIQEAVDVLFANELQLFTDRLQDMQGEELGHVMDRLVPDVNRVFALLHQRRLRQFLDQIYTGEKPQGDQA